MMKARHFARRFSLQPALYEEDRPTPVSKEEDAAGSPGAGGAASTSGVSVDKPGEDPTKRRYRVVVMGAAKVGKTAIINQFLYDSFTPKYTRTVEEMHHGEYEVSGMSLTLDILDTSGSYEFPAMRELSVNQADAFILVYAITDADSFQEVRNLREMIMGTKNKPVPIVVVGNKNDLEEQRAVPTEMAETTVLVNWENGFLEASAKDNLNVLHIFKELLNQAKIRYALSPAVKRRRQSMPNVGMQITPAQLSHLQHIKQKHSGKRNSCVIS
ncbi:ras-related protein Rap-1b-like isoform X1 [Penaeus chinensis]|uniref:ras-related protein Rap-1b-like isoform X1 n=1 Tax=Penaeus chinensis TaxID=139456 RepID=UPI001FB82A4B|nr:ras-related protein Rap-1b-like isoform X1 [Penaeus chinensis]XP_047499075.1 ras-related protein Rap-1b-like isoform X1 [Penaeus chinensis]